MSTLQYIYEITGVFNILSNQFCFQLQLSIIISQKDHYVLPVSYYKLIFLAHHLYYSKSEWLNLVFTTTTTSSLPSHILLYVQIDQFFRNMERESGLSHLFPDPHPLVVRSRESI